MWPMASLTRSICRSIEGNPVIQRNPCGIDVLVVVDDGGSRRIGRSCQGRGSGYSSGRRVARTRSPPPSGPRPSRPDRGGTLQSRSSSRRSSNQRAHRSQAGARTGSRGAGIRYSPPLLFPTTVAWSSPQGSGAVGGSRHLGGRKDLVEHLKRWDGRVDHLPTDRPRREVEEVRGSSSTATSVSQRTTRPSGRSSGHLQGTGHFVAVGGSRVERIDGAHRDAAGPQMVEGVRGVRAHDVDDQVTGIDPGDGGERHEPAERFEVEPRMFVDDTGEGSGIRLCVVLVRSD